MTDEIWQRVDHHVSAPVGDGVVILDIDNGVYYSFTETAAAIWNLLIEPHDAQGIESALQAQFDVPADRCAAAVQGFLVDLAGKDLIRQVN
jgi:hypothetical protein